MLQEEKRENNYSFSQEEKVNKKTTSKMWLRKFLYVSGFNAGT